MPRRRPRERSCRRSTAGAWWAPLTAGLYPGLVLLRLGQDPVVLAACLVAVCGVRWTRPRGSGVTSS